MVNIEELVKNTKPVETQQKKKGHDDVPLDDFETESTIEGEKKKKKKEKKGSKETDKKTGSGSNEKSTDPKSEEVGEKKKSEEGKEEKKESVKKEMKEEKVKKTDKKASEVGSNHKKGTETAAASGLKTSAKEASKPPLASAPKTPENNGSNKEKKECCTVL